MGIVSGWFLLSYGFYRTAMWIDPVSGIYIIVLTNRVHPYGKGDAGPLRRQIIELVAEALGPLSEGNILAKRPLLSGYYSKTVRCRQA